MIELFEKELKNNNMHSSKGNQLKWERENIWYKADYTGYEGLSEYIISNLLLKSTLNSSEFVVYNLEQFKYGDLVLNGAKSVNFLKDKWQIITLERLFQSFTQKSLHTSIWTISSPKERLKFLVDSVVDITGLKDFGIYMNKLLTIDMLFLNEDRHTHNIAVLMDDKGDFDYCPIFDNGAGLMSDTILDYPVKSDIYKLIGKVKGKTFLASLEEQTNISEILYGENLHFNFTKNDVIKLLDLNGDKKDNIYPLEIKNRVANIIFEQMRKYPYLFK